MNQALWANPILQTIHPCSLAWMAALGGGWLLTALAGMLKRRSIRFVARALFPLGALLCVAMAVSAGGYLLFGLPEANLTLPLGLPDLPFHLHLDALAAFFLLLLGFAGAGISTYAAGYFRTGEGTSPGLLCLYYHVFLASMAFVILAGDAYFFLVAWEAMALSSFFLVTAQHRLPEIRRAGFLYLLMAHLGALCILLCFGVLQGGGWLFTFDAMRMATLTPAAATAAFVLALVGFGAKAGMVPLHVWLPEAHPAAPSPVSAMMSGLMLKTAIYGLLRVVFDLLHLHFWQWGVAVLALGLLTGMLGAVFAAVQTDMKRLLAYSSIENIGLILIAIGLALLFLCSQMSGFAALALTAALVHALNHSLFKSMLFLSTGSVLHATRQRSLGKLGGLIRTMPWVATLALVATLAIAGLPPLNGFLSEWLLLQSFLFTPALPQSFFNMLIPIGAAALALIVALGAYVMVKFYGVIFLGQPREELLHEAHDANWLERIGLVWLGAGCVLIGVQPQIVIGAAGRVTAMLLGEGGVIESTPWRLSLVTSQHASYSGFVFLAVTACVVAGAFLAVRLLAHGRTRRAAPWDCGYPWQDAHMQDTAEGFGQPIRHMFGFAFWVRRISPAPSDEKPQYSIHIEDRFWRILYAPAERITALCSAALQRMQGGRLSFYLLYSFLTLIALLVIVL